MQIPAYVVKSSPTENCTKLTIWRWTCGQRHNLHTRTQYYSRLQSNQSDIISVVQREIPIHNNSINGHKSRSATRYNAILCTNHHNYCPRTSRNFRRTAHKKVNQQMNLQNSILIADINLKVIYILDHTLRRCDYPTVTDNDAGAIMIVTKVSGGGAQSQ